LGDAIGRLELDRTAEGIADQRAQQEAPYSMVKRVR
jgi:hypothetical protein